jgi:hypothetical protein
MRSGEIVRTLSRLSTLVALAACSSTGPSLVVTLSGPSTVQGFDTTIAGVASYGCHYALTATTSAAGVHEFITWQTGHYTYVRQDGATLSGDYQGAAGLFGGALVLGQGKSVSAVQGNFWTLPFEFSEVLYYSRATSSKHADSAQFSYSCQ